MPSGRGTSKDELACPLEEGLQKTNWRFGQKQSHVNVTTRKFFTCTQSTHHRSHQSTKPEHRVRAHQRSHHSTKPEHRVTAHHPEHQARAPSQSTPAFSPVKLGRPPEAPSTPPPSRRRRWSPIRCSRCCGRRCCSSRRQW